MLQLITLTLEFLKIWRGIFAEQFHLHFSGGCKILQVEGLPINNISRILANYDPPISIGGIRD
jgi:hypothetical protein